MPITSSAGTPSRNSTFSRSLNVNRSKAASSRSSWSVVGTATVCLIGAMHTVLSVGSVARIDGSVNIYGGHTTL